MKAKDNGWVMYYRNSDSTQRHSKPGNMYKEKVHLHRHVTAITEINAIANNASLLFMLS